MHDDASPPGTHQRHNTRDLHQICVLAPTSRADSQSENVLRLLIPMNKAPHLIKSYVINLKQDVGAWKL